MKLFRFACLIAAVWYSAGCKNNGVSSSEVKETPAACQVQEKKLLDLKAEMASLVTVKSSNSSTTSPNSTVSRPAVISESECSKGDGIIRGDQCTCDSGEVMEPAKGEFCTKGQWVEGLTGLPIGGYFNRKTCMQNSGEFLVDKNACKCAKGELIYNTFDMRQWCASGRPAAATAGSKPAALGLTGDIDESLDLEPDFDDPVGFGLTAPRSEATVQRELDEATVLLATCVTKNTAAGKLKDQPAATGNSDTAKIDVDISANQYKCLCTVFRQKIPQSDKVNRLCLVARKGENGAWKVIRRLSDDVDCKSQCDNSGGEAIKDMKSAACSK